KEELPSSIRQWDSAKFLLEELISIGLEDFSINENAYVMGFIPSNIDKNVPTIGFISHFDTSPDYSGENVRPQIIENYDGGNILLNAELKMNLNPDEFPELKQYKGQTIICTDGTTWWGEDDDAGVGEIGTAA